jgi:hypothetical protein
MGCFELHEISVRLVKLRTFNEESRGMRRQESGDEAFLVFSDHLHGFASVGRD